MVFSYTTIIKMHVTTLLLACFFPSNLMRTLWMATDPLHE